MPHKFYIEYFEPKHLKRAHEMVERHLNEIKKERTECKEEVQKVLKRVSLWERIKLKLHIS